MNMSYDTPRYFRNNVLHMVTVEPLIMHTPRWAAQGMHYEGLCVWRGMLKIGSKNHQKCRRIQKNLNPHIHGINGTEINVN